MIVEKLFLIHAGILGLISFFLIVAGNFLGEYWMRKRRFGKFRKTHGYILLVAYVISVAHVGEGLTAYVDLLGAFSGLSLALHLLHIVLAIIFLAYFTKVLVDGYRGVMKCRDGRIVLLLNIVIIILGYVLRNVAFGEVFYPFG
jgi:hypothetical protein